MLEVLLQDIVVYSYFEYTLAFFLYPCEISKIRDGVPIKYKNRI